MKKKNEKEVFPCDGCNRIFSGRTNHERECKGETVFGVQKLKEYGGKRGDKRKTDEAHAVTSNSKTHDVNNNQKNDRAPASPPPPPTIFKWGENDSFHFMKMLDDAYVHIFNWRKNLFMLPSGKSGKSFIETTRFLNTWVDDSPLKTATFKEVMVMPSLYYKNHRRYLKTSIFL